MKDNELEEKRYARNRETISLSDQKQLAKSSVCVIGCGGLGGIVIEGLARAGVGSLTVVDCDAFEPSNLNRQILSNELNLGQPKAVAAKTRVDGINSSVRIRAIQEKFTTENGRKIIHGCSVVVDALDNVSSRMVLEKLCEEEGIPLVHGAIGGWNGQLAVVMPGDRLLHRLYGINWEEDSCQKTGRVTEEKRAGNPSFTPMVLSGMEVAETIKLLIGQKTPVAGKVLMVSLRDHQYEILDI